MRKLHPCHLIWAYHADRNLKEKNVPVEDMDKLAGEVNESTPVKATCGDDVGITMYQRKRPKKSMSPHLASGVEVGVTNDEGRRVLPKRQSRFICV